MTNKEAKATLEVFQEDILNNLWLSNEQRKGLAESLDLAIKALDKRPQGQWVYSEAFNRKVYKCSLCNNISLMPFYNFCPNCGADMREGGKSHEEVHSNI